MDNLEQRARFSYLCTMWAAGPLSGPEFEEFKQLCKQFRPAMLEWIES